MPLQMRNEQERFRGCRGHEGAWLALFIRVIKSDQWQQRRCTADGRVQVQYKRDEYNRGAVMMGEEEVVAPAPCIERKDRE
jgi:hypothetical protein